MAIETLATSETTTDLIARAIGGYMIAAGVSGLTMRDRWKKILEGLRENAALSYLTGVFVFALGCAMVMAHNRWHTPLEILVSFFGWGALIEGILLIALPRPFLSLSASLLRPGAVFPFALGAMIAGIALFIVSCL